MDISELSRHGVTIVVRCKGYEGKNFGASASAQVAHEWTAYCKPWDVVRVTVEPVADSRSYADALAAEIMD
jgi:hypothetical protein